MTPERPLERYRRTSVEADSEARALESRMRRISALRMTVFLVSVLLILLAGEIPGSALVWYVGGALGLGVFAVLVGRHRRLRERLDEVEVARELALEGIARVERDWAALAGPFEAVVAPGPDHPYERDLDLFGRASIRALLGPTATPMGRRTLDGWLLDPPHGAEERQQVARELAARHDLREASAVAGRLLDEVPEEAVAGLLAWVAEPPALSPALRVVRWVLPALTLVLAALHVAGVLPAAGWVIGLLVQAVIAWRESKRLHPGFGRASSGVPGLRRYHTLLEVWEHATLEAPSGRALVGDIAGSSDALRRLAAVLDAADARFSGMLHPVVAVGVLWDLHVQAGLDGWRRQYGDRVRVWLDALGAAEALAALGTLAADHPDWGWATFSEAEPPVLRARALGHPLLSEADGVRNDVEVGPPGTVLWITGSNMSGKSTLLRSIGCAAVLARAGGPVCAESLELPPVHVFTSMRIEDSIERGVSLFLAELRRLKAILDAAPEAGSGGDTLLYLVDEVLQGTNSEERRIAGRRVVRHLLGRRAIGALTTHDLGLHEHPAIEPVARLVHLREAVSDEGEGPGLVFDYRLREGLATTRNALRLAERIGLTEPDAGES